MSRQEKRSRMRMLPPRLQLQQRDAHTGSYPTVSRFSTDGRTGTYNTSFNDTKTVVFGGHSDYNPGVGFNTSSPWFSGAEVSDIQTPQEPTPRYEYSLGREKVEFVLNAGKDVVYLSGISAVDQAIVFPDAGGYYILAVSGSGAATDLAYVVHGDSPAGALFLADNSTNSYRSAGDYCYRVTAITQSFEPMNGYSWADDEQSLSTFTGESGSLFIVVKDIPKFTKHYPESGGYYIHLKSDAKSVEYGDGYVHEYVKVDSYSYTGIGDTKIYLTQRIKFDFNNAYADTCHFATLIPPDTAILPILTTGNIRSQVIDGLPFMHFTTGQELTPFRDNIQPAADGKSSNSAFFATGSAELLIGEGFSSPLWSKNKIEIDVSVPIECGSDLYMSGHGYGLSVPADSAIGVSYEMLYFNFTSKTWQGIGKGISHGSTHYGKDFSGITSSPVPFEDMAMIGFSPSIISQYIDNSINQVSGAFEQQAGAGEPFTNLGFPWHPKFHATSSQICNMSQYINAPFLVEKIVVELSAAYSISNDVYSLTTLTNSYNSITNLTQSTVPAAINNFFILNQRNPSSFFHMENMRAYGNDAVITSSIPTNIVLAKNSQETYVDTVRDILTWGGISSFANNMPSSVTRGGAAISYSASTLPVLTMNPKQLMTRDCVFSSPLNVTTDLTPLSWAGSVYMALPAKSPKMIDSNDIDIAKSKCFSELSVVADETGGEPDSRLYLKFGGGGRDALGITIPNGRNFISPISEITTIGGIKNSFNVNQYIITTDDRYRYNPYILFPTDNLIFGWQQPLISKIMYSVALPDKNFIPGIFSSIRFLPGEAKVTLYGSYISNDKEHNDGTNQLLSSNSVHEVIGSE